MARDLRLQLSDDDMPTLGQKQSLTDDGNTDMYGTATNRNADHHTIVDMNLRTVRFVVVVVMALVTAFSYAFLTSNQVVVAKLASPELLEDKVSMYNVLLGTTMFAASKVFEIYTETLIFPTLHTYLHNCSLYPGDVPQRVSSKVKSNCIFWGLKTVIILMNVGFASLFVSQRVRGGDSTVSSRRLDAANTGVFASYLSRQTIYPFDIDKSGCNTSQQSQWLSADLDYTSAVFGFPRWSESEKVVAALFGVESVASVTLRGDECARSPAHCTSVLTAANVSQDDVIQLLSGRFSSNTPTRLSADVLSLTEGISHVALSIEEPVTFPSTNTSRLRVERFVLDDGNSMTLASVEVKRRVPSSAVACGQRHCVATVAFDANEMMTLSSVGGKHRIKAATRRVESTPSGAIHEIVTVAFAELIVPTLPSLKQLPATEIPLVSIQRVVLPQTSGLKTWLPISNFAPANGQGSCTPLVDAYADHIIKNSLILHPSALATTLLTAAMLHLTQPGGVPSQETLTLERRLVVTAGDVVSLRLSIPRSSAIATFAGCAAMVLLTVFVIWRPAERVRLSPNTTPAAQYVQILTDDLYPDIVHKKRLRFTNGDMLPFNEYVVDSIVLQAKRDPTKKIYLSV